MSNEAIFLLNNNYVSEYLKLVVFGGNCGWYLLVKYQPQIAYER